jgi:hypothetical protein
LFGSSTGVAAVNVDGGAIDCVCCHDLASVDGSDRRSGEVGFNHDVGNEALPCLDQRCHSRQ